MFLIICLHGSRRADFSLFPPMPDRNNTNRVRHTRQGSCARLRINVPGVSADDVFRHRARRVPPPAVARRTKRKSGVTTPEFPLDHTPLSRRCTALRAMPRRPSGRCEGSFPHTLRAPRPRLRAGNASLVIQGFSSKSRVRPQAPWAACRRTWRRSLRCSPRPLSRVPCPR